MATVKLTADVQKRIVDAVKAGNYVTVAARYAGISTTTFYRWCRRGGEARSGRYYEFLKAVRQAETYAEIRAVAIIQKEMQDNWRAAVAYLERKFPERWGPEKKRHLLPSGQPRKERKNVGPEYDTSQLAEIARLLEEVGGLVPRARQAADSPAD